MHQNEFLGADSINRLPEIINKYNAKKILLVTGKKSYSNSGAEGLISRLLSGKQLFKFSDFSVNASLDDAQKGIQLIKDNDPDIVISVGGGSVIDMGKIINILAFNKPNNISRIISKGLPLVAIPTTAGTGSEATSFAAVYINGVKYSLSHEYVLPDYSIVDPIFSYNMPAKLAAESGIDALSQAVESYWSVKSTIKSKKYASEAILQILPNLIGAVSGDEKSINAMTVASNLSGKAINITTTTAPHAISYAITTHYGVPHGHAVGLLLGCFFEINSDIDIHKINDSRGKAYIKNNMCQLYNFFGKNDPLSCKIMWYEMMNNIGLETNISKLGIKTKRDIDLISNGINIERLRNNPLIIDKATITNVLKSIL